MNSYSNSADSDSKGLKPAELLRLPWFALQVHTRHEIGVAAHLRELGFEEFLPLYKCRKRWSDRVKEIQAPLFPGYLFCRFDPQKRLPVLKVPGVVQIVGYSRVPVAVDEDEIRSIQILVRSGLPNQPWPFLQIGKKVRIDSGPLRELEGVLIQFRGNRRLIVSVSLLRRSVAVEIDADFVSPESNSVPQLERAYLKPQLLPLSGD